MNRSHIIALLILTTALAIIISTVGNTSVYVTFEEAKKRVGKQVHVVGTLQRNHIGKVIGIAQDLHQQVGTFMMIDNSHTLQKVYYNHPLPIDLIRSEQLVVIGEFYQNQFIASKILLKCPSKYNSTKQVWQQKI